MHFSRWYDTTYNLNNHGLIDNDSARINDKLKNGPNTTWNTSFVTGIFSFAGNTIDIQRIFEPSRVGTKTVLSLTNRLFQIEPFW